jgi:hypothetical protein
MDRALSSALREATRNWLNRLEMLVEHSDGPSRAALAETELIRMIAAWRVVLAQHEPDGDGRCQRCSTHWRRRRAQPCCVWVVVHRYLVVDDVRARAVTPGGTGERTASRSG